MKLLLVEDDPILGRGLSVNLGLENFQVKWVTRLSHAFESFSSDIEAVVLDLGLPDGSGLDFLKHVRNQGSLVPILILTAQTDEDSVVQGLESGANDYMKKPFGHRELLARLKNITRSQSRADGAPTYGGLRLSTSERTCYYQDQIVELNRREFDILEYFVQNAERIVTRESLIEALKKDGEIFDRTIDSHISHLRTKFKKSGVSEIKVSSVYGVGYRLEKN